jgi:hypothetical protein
MKKIPFTDNPQIHDPTEIEAVLSEAVNEANIIGNSKGERFYNVPASFDIETTSFYRDADGKAYTYEQVSVMQDANGRKAKLEKAALMYVWQFGINGRIIVGRTWEQFTEMCERITNVLHLSEKLRLVVYVHNLSYEFQFLRKWFEWVRVFSIDLRKPIYAITAGFIEFRCSYLLSGYSLAKLGEQLLKYKCSKAVGNLDYSKMRHTETPLTEAEIKYCVDDIRVVMCYIQERLEECKGITHVPITKTGFVRKYCRKHCLRNKNEQGKTVPNWEYVNLMEELQISGMEEFNMLQRAFAGGFTHANAEYADEVIPDVDSYDFTSSYPYVMVAEQYPMSKGVRLEVKSMKQFEFLISKYCCVFDIEFTNIFASETQDNPISVSKCFIKQNACENNGRIVAASKIALTITDVDYNIIRNFYTWENMRVGCMYCYKRGYLPTVFVRSILQLYESKTKLKGVEGKEVEYLNSKEMLNSCYGMSVTNPLRDEFTYNGEWDINAMSPEQKEELLYKYNTSKNRFLFYAWGIFVTAYARRNLFTGIYEMKDDYIYSDTDSIKIKNGDRHTDYFKAYNMQAVEKLRKACKWHGLPFSLVEPETIKGITKTLGIWDYEGRYTAFKTLGAKRYMVQHEAALKAGGKTYNFSLTVSGVNKKAAIPYLIEKYGENGIFDAFTNYLDIPPTATGKNIHTYIDYEIQGELTDYTGLTAPYTERSGVHLEPTGYSLSLSVMYINYLRGIKFKD